MNRLLILVAIATSCIGCDKRHSSTAEQPAKITVNCMIVRWEPSFLESFGRAKDARDPFILNDLETFFFIDHPTGIKSTPIEFGANETARLPDTFGSGFSDEYVYVKSKTSNHWTRLTITSAKGSKIKLDDDVNVDLPKFGSAIIKTANPLRDGRYTYLWVMARQ